MSPQVRSQAALAHVSSSHTNGDTMYIHSSECRVTMREKRDQEEQTSIQSLLIRDFFPENAPWHFIQKTLHAQTWRTEAKLGPLPSEHLSLFTSFIGHWWVFLFEK